MSETSDPNRNRSSTRWASFPFTRNFGENLAWTHSLDVLSSEWAWSIELMGCRVNCSEYIPFWLTGFTLPISSVVNSPSVSCRTTSRTPTGSPSRDFCEVVRPSLYQDDFNIEPAICGFIPLIRQIFGYFPRFFAGGQGRDFDIIC